MSSDKISKIFFHKNKVVKK